MFAVAEKFLFDRGQFAASKLACLRPLSITGVDAGRETSGCADPAQVEKDSGRTGEIGVSDSGRLPFGLLGDSGHRSADRRPIRKSRIFRRLAQIDLRLTYVRAEIPGLRRMKGKCPSAQRQFFMGVD
jgi:hypothetical protein